MASRPESGSMVLEAVSEAVSEAIDAAHSAGLHYVTEHSPGYQRMKRGRGFRYLTADGQRVTDKRELARIKALAIPPAWTEVWICASAHGHIQAFGRDARRRKQYRYHARWREVRDETKFGQLLEFGATLPQIRKRVDADMAKPGLPREKVLATVVRLLELTMARIGNPEYARANRSFGITTLRDRHVQVTGHTLRFRFIGKSGKPHDLKITDRRVAKVVRACQDIPGYEVFKYLDDEEQVRDVDSADVNDYLREISGADFTAKLFRTWAGSVEALESLQTIGPADSPTAAKRNVVQVVKEVAGALRNTPAVCRKSYIHPAIVNRYTSGTLIETLGSIPRSRAPQRLTAPERLLMAFLEKEAKAA
jgi:DNA topoisomerase-1